MTFSNCKLTSSAVAIAAAMLATSASAQTAPPENARPSVESGSEIVVTAQRRSERSVDVPITITTLSSQQLEDAGAKTLSDISRVTPALRFDAATNFVQPTIRGVGTAVATSGVGSNVGIYVDGFYQPNPIAADFQLMNVQSVQVLKGPQGTLFGRNTTGGAILVSTSDPSTRPSAELKASYGSYNTTRLQGYGTVGLGENAAVDAEGLFTKGDGFVKNIISGRDDDGAYKNWSIRTGLKVDFTPNFSGVLRYKHTDTDDGTNTAFNIYSDPKFGVGTNLPAVTYTTDPDKVDSGGPTGFTSKSDTLQLTLAADLGFADLHSYSQYSKDKSLILNDLDATGANVFRIDIGVEDKTFSQELLLTSKPGPKLQWTTGLFYFSSEDNWTTAIGAPLAGNPKNNIRLGGSGTTTTTLAGFADLTYELTDTLFLTAGARYSHDEVNDPYYIVPFSGVQTPTPALSDDKVTPRVVLRYQPNNESSIYASYAKGYKAGILDVGGGTGDKVNPENIDAYEIGYKFDNRRLSASVSAFYYDYKDLQVSLYVTSPSGAPSAKVLNAASSTIYGLEGSFAYEVTDNLSVNAGASWTHARYEEFNNAPIYTRCPVTPPVFGACGPGNSFAVLGATLKDVDMQRTPEFTGNIGARYTTGLAEGSLALSGNLYYTSEFYFGPSGTQFLQDAYSTLGLRAEWTDPSGKYAFAVYGDNVTDERYRTQVAYNTFGVGSAWNYPATWGVSLDAKF